MTSGKQARQARQAKVAAAAPKRSPLTPILVTVVVVLALVGVGAAIVLGLRSGPSQTASGVPAGATGDSGGIVATAGTVKAGAPTLDVYEDFQCSHCAEFHAQLGPTIDQLATSGEAKVVVHLKTFMDDNMRNDLSTKTANAAACAADAGAFLRFHDAAFDGYLAAGDPTAAYSAEARARYAQAAGITGPALETWRTCESKGTYTEYLKRVEDETNRAGIRGTPAFRINGKDLDLGTVTSAEAFRAAVLAGGAPAPTGAASGSPATPSPTPSR